jgi:predicted MFS family arabinose efflux permease
MSRAVAGHAASIGLSGALSFACADLLARAYGWRAAFVVAAAGAAVAWLVVAVCAPRTRPAAAGAARDGALFDFRPVFRNRSAMAYAQAYCIHTLEMNALRGWGVAFLGFVAVASGAERTWLSPAIVLTALGLIGTVASVVGNEMAIRLGRRRLISTAMAGSILVAAMLGYLGTLSYGIAVALLLVYGFVVWLDSSSLTAGAAGTAEPARRGATLSVNSSLGDAGGYVGPLLIGYTLDALGGMSRASWSAAFASIAALMLVSLIFFRVLRPRELAGDRGSR